MRVKCVICDRIESIEDHSFTAKKLRNRPIHTYTCDVCYDRITEKTNKRIATGKFKFNVPNENEDDW